MRLLPPLLDDMAHIYDVKIQDIAKDTHRLVEPKIQNIWTDVYTRCALECGNGHYKRSQKTHIAHAKNVKRSMYRNCSTDIEDALRKLCHSIEGEFSQDLEAKVLKRVSEDFETLLESYTACEESYNPILIEAKRELQREASKHWGELFEGWATPINFKSVEVQSETIEERPFPTIDDLLDDDDDDIHMTFRNPFAQNS